MAQDESLPLAEVLADGLVQEAFDQHNVAFGIAEQDVYTPAVTLWAMIGQMRHAGPARSVKAAAGRVVSLLALTQNRVVANNPASFCRAKAKIPLVVVQQITRQLASRTGRLADQLDPLTMPLPPDAAELRASPAIIARLRRAKITGRMTMADGWIVDGPDTEANCRVFPKNPSVADGLGFALIRCVGLYCMVTGLLIDLATAAYCGKGTGEMSLMRLWGD